ncbi:MAG: carbamoyl phosphate synthase small subunit, partial [Tidjanibacter sp.]|nr:carbamoyl phosphate synthase small subunit [Tidjanibacter sp.]
MENYTKKLVLEDGSQFYGYGFGADKVAVCELVFNTSVVGYQEILSDPSYAGQMVVMTYPLIGNYGITDEDFETKVPYVGAMVVRENNNLPSNFRYTKTFGEVLEESGVPAISGVDTRMITKKLSREGSTRAALVDADMAVEDAVALIKNTPVESDLISRVSCRKRWFSRTPHHKFDVVAVDCGIKYSIIRRLNAWGCNVTIVPYNTSAEEILSFNPDGVMIPNGPG